MATYTVVRRDTGEEVETTASEYRALVLADAFNVLHVPEGSECRYVVVSSDADDMDEWGVYRPSIEIEPVDVYDMLVEEMGISPDDAERMVS